MVIESDQLARTFIAAQYQYQGFRLFRLHYICQHCRRTPGPTAKVSCKIQLDAVFCPWCQDSVILSGDLSFNGYTTKPFSQIIPISKSGVNRYYDDRHAYDRPTDSAQLGVRQRRISNPSDSGLAGNISLMSSTSSATSEKTQACGRPKSILKKDNHDKGGSKKKAVSYRENCPPFFTWRTAITEATSNTDDDEKNIVYFLLEPPERGSGGCRGGMDRRWADSDNRWWRYSDKVLKKSFYRVTPRWFCLYGHLHDVYGPQSRVIVPILFQVLSLMHGILQVFLYHHKYGACLAQSALYSALCCGIIDGPLFKLCIHLNEIHGDYILSSQK
ncbi:hypothetical protein EV368DRAFT_67937 [Lentinula lateritia]|nr:hypothetical protein EV368DRAFT_67937 [Lentinula lateritia]